MSDQHIDCKPKRVYLAYPEDWGELTEEQKHQVALQVASRLIEAPKGEGEA